MINWKFFVFCVLVISSIICLNLAESRTPNRPSQKPLWQDWRVAARADLVAVGSLSRPKETDGFFEISTSIDGFLKGTHSGQVFVSYFPNVRDPMTGRADPPMSQFTVPEKRVLFLVHHPVEHKRTKPSNYFLFANEKAIQSNSEIARIRSELSNQLAIEEYFSETRMARPDKHDKEVARLIVKLKAKQTESQALKSLLGLDFSFVPALIRAMNDTASIEDTIGIETSPQLFRHTVSGVLMDVCAKLTKEQFPSPQGWRVWLYYQSD